jgi:heme/copper-type cytochrome/quinol oxidase subunit 4
LIITLIITLIYFIFTSGGASSSSSRLHLLSSPAFIQLLLWIIVFTLFQAALIFIGHMTNEMMESHG